MATPVADMPPELLASLKYQQEHIEDDRTALLVGVTWFLWTLAIIAVALRFYAERMMRSPWRHHDILIVLGLFFTTGLCINTTIGTAFGAGRHLILADAEDITNTAKLLFGFTFIYAFANTTIKASLLVFFYQTFPNRIFRIAVWSVGVLATLWLLAMVLGTIFQCTPVDFTWNKNQVGHCINIATLFVSLGIINAVIDIIIVAMPLPLIWKLQLPKGRKIGVCGIFALSSIVIVASIVRPIYLGKLNTYDLTYEGIDIGLWCIVEPTLAIVGACLPLMAPLFKKVKEMGSSRGKTSGTSAGSSGWDHIRNQEGHTVASQKPWGKESEGGAVPAYMASSDNAPLTSHHHHLHQQHQRRDRAADEDSENNVSIPSRSDLEMQTLPKTFNQ